jgi:hypothetical protein
MAEQDEFVQLKLRVRASLRAQLEGAAAIGSPSVSVNQEAVGRLERSFEEDKQLDDLRRENRELRETIRRMVDAFDKALDTIQPDPLRDYRREAAAARQGSEP